MGDKLIVTRRVGAVNVITTGDRTVVSRDRRQVVSVGTRGPAGPAGAAGPAGPAGAAGYPTPVSPGVPLVGKTDGSGVEYSSSILGGLAFYSPARNALNSTFQIDDDGTEYYTSIVTETGTYAVTINQDKVGINTALASPTPAARLHVYDDFGTQLRLQGFSQSTDFTTLAGGLFVATTGDGIYHQVGGGTTAQYVSSSGIGVGTTAPGARHDIRTGSAGRIGQVIRGATSQTADLQQWQTSAGTTVAAVTADGRVGVGTAPVSNSTLHIKMPGTKQGFIVTNGDSSGIQTWFGFTTGPGPLGTSNDEYVNFYKDPTGWVWNSDKSGTGTARAVRWTHAGSERMRINGTGIGFLGVTPAAQQAGGAATAGGTYGATEQSMLQKAYDALRTFGLLS